MIEDFDPEVGLDDGWDDEEPTPYAAGPDLGPCCCCGATGATVRNIIMLDKKSPIAGRGWGCLQCGLKSDGAVIVMCDACLAVNAPPRWACRGYPGSDGRIPISELAGTHEHDFSRHLNARHRAIEPEH